MIHFPAGRHKIERRWMAKKRLTDWVCQAHIIHDGSSSNGRVARDKREEQDSRDLRDKRDR